MQFTDTLFFQKVFQTTALALSDWAFLGIFMVIIFFLEEFRKKIFSRRYLASKYI